MVNAEQKDNKLIVSYIDETGNISLKEYVIPESEMFEWVYTERDADPVVKSWDGKKVKKQPNKYLTKYRLTEFLMTIPQRDQEIIFANNKPKKYFCDIETEILESFADAKNPKAAIQSITIASEKEYILGLGTKKLSTDQISEIQDKLNEHFKSFDKTIKFEYSYFTSEFDMLYAFFNKAIKKLPLITGWNFVDFDWSYLVARANKLDIDTTVCSPTKSFTYNGMPNHKIIVDYLQIYRKWDTMIQMKEFNTLDFVSETALGVRKIKYNGSLTDLYNNDFQGYIFYNAVDSYLVRLLDEKLNTLSIYSTFAYLTRVEQDRVFKPVAMVENIMIQQLWKDRKRVFVKQNDKNEKDGKYKGAFVIEPNIGIYKYITTFDYSSLYPTIIREWNISPDVFIKKDINVKPTENIITTASGAIFRKDQDGVLKTLLTDLFKRRKEAKNIAGEVESEINELEKIIKSK